MRLHLPRWPRDNKGGNRPAKDAQIQPRGAYIWYDEKRALRIFLVGNNALRPAADRAAYLAMMARIGKLVNPSYELGNDLVKVHQHYVRIYLSKARNQQSLTKLVAEILAAIKDYLGWDALPILGYVNSFKEYETLNEQHGDRWPPRSFLER